MTWSRMDEDALLPVIATVQAGGVGTDTASLVGGSVIPVVIVVPGPGAGLVRTSATTTTTITRRPTIARQGIKGLFFFRTTRQFGQTVRPDSMDAPQ